MKTSIAIAPHNKGQGGADGADLRLVVRSVRAVSFA